MSTEESDEIIEFPEEMDYWIDADGTIEVEEGCTASLADQAIIAELDEVHNTWGFIGNGERRDVDDAL